MKLFFTLLKASFSDKNFDFKFEYPKHSLPAFVDPAQMEKVLFNLLSNALKYTPAFGTIKLTIEESTDNIQIRIYDTGSGIPSDHLANIFSDFYQIKTRDTQQTGWGIGLALVKNILDLHKAQITVQSKLATHGQEGYSEFCISLLKGHAHFTAQELAVEPEGLPSERLEKTELPLIKENITEVALDQQASNKHILVIEDNDELREFIIQSLQQNYRVTGCTNGLEGWEYAVENLPDLIISDVTMPVMDGYEVCKRIKSEERTNHIPVVMLTAMASHIHQVEGLESGADVYITKPFSIQVLELNIRNLLLAKEVLRAKYHKQVLLTPSKVEGQNPEEKFLSKLMQIVEDKMEDPEFNVSALVTEIGMSQTVLYKKIKVITDLSITDFIKSVRLKRAAQLLKDGHTAIAEVAYAVGFNDRKYFSKEFKKQFGVVPSDYASKSDES